MRKLNNRHSGFGLIEVLVAMVILAIGVIAIGKLQADLLTGSAENKAVAEAIALAQARIEERRNYTNQANDQTEFETAFAAANNTAVTGPLGYATFNQSNQIIGQNALFSMTETIAANGNARDITVSVSWTDSEGNAQTVSAQTMVNFNRPRTVANLGNDDFEPLVEPPIGRAYLGAGTLDGTEDLQSDNNDGTFTLGCTEGSDCAGNLLLATSTGEGAEVVLTLEDACNLFDSDGNPIECTNFVTISGRVYIDADYTDDLPHQLFVVASDAAFCARYTDAGVTMGTGTGETTTVDSTSPNGDYKYYNYTCYLGGAWHGNIGLSFSVSQASGNNTAAGTACVGDPTSANAWEQPVEASRRAYRGMMYEHDNDNVPNEFTNEEGSTLVRYYSWGIADSSALPSSGSAGHDFVVGELGNGQLPADCQEMMTYDDSNVSGTPGDRFAGIPSDFVCLNEVESGAIGLEAFDDDDNSLGNSHLDDARYDSEEDGFEANCPYDPTNPPYWVYEVSGSLTMTGSSTPSNLAVLETLQMVTSDAEGNCTITGGDYSGGAYHATYVCEVFDEGEYGNGNNATLSPAGWSGYVELDISEVTEAVDCSDAQQVSVSNISGNVSGYDIACTVDAGESVLMAVDDSNMSITEGNTGTFDVLANDSLVGTNPGFYLVPTLSNGGASLEISGTSIIYNGNNAATEGSDTFVYSIRNDEGAVSEATVTIAISSSNLVPNAVNDSVETDQGVTNLQINPLGNDSLGNNGVITAVSAGNNGASVSFEGSAIFYTPEPEFSGTETFTYTITDDDNETSSATVTVTVNSAAGPDRILTFTVVSSNGAKLNSVAPSSGGTCAVLPNNMSSGQSTCTVPDDWSGTLTFTSSKKVCSSGIVEQTSTASVGIATFTNVNANQNFNVTMQNNCS